MRQDYEKLFTHLDIPEPPADLLPKIMSRIQGKRHFFNLKQRLIIFSLSTVSSVVALIFTFKMVWTGFFDSGFLQFFSLLFSDFEVVVSYWRNFVMSLFETLPAMGLILFLGSMLIFIKVLLL